MSTLTLVTAVACESGVAFRRGSVVCVLGEREGHVCRDKNVYVDEFASLHQPIRPHQHYDDAVTAALVSIEPSAVATASVAGSAAVPAPAPAPTAAAAASLSTPLPVGSTSFART